MGCAAAATVGAALGTTTDMLPASAAGAGKTLAGYSNTTGNGEPSAPLCLPATGVTIKLYSTPSLTSDTKSITTTFKSIVDFWFGPGGTFSDNLCTKPTGATTPITGNLAVSGPGISCSLASADYQRVGTDYVIRTLVATGPCGDLKYTGVQKPCGPAPLPDTCGPDDNTASEFQGTYVQG